MKNLYLSMVEDEHVRIGFALAATCISLAWNADWRHYISYWTRAATPSRWKVVMLRTFFFVCLGGAVSDLVRELASSKPSLTEVAVSLLDAIVIMAIFFALNSYFRWNHRGPK